MLFFLGLVFLSLKFLALELISPMATDDNNDWENAMLAASLRVMHSVDELASDRQKGLSC